MFAKLTALTLAVLVAVAQAAPGPICDCPDRGRLLSTQPAIQCAYPNGACTYNEFGILLNTNQNNCESKIFFNDHECPKDRDNSNGVLINQLLAFTCEIGPFEKCSYDATGHLESGSSRSCPSAVSPCVKK